MSRVVTLPPAEPVRSDGIRAGGWWHELEEKGRIHCDLCPRACVLKPGDRGFCFVRENLDGQMVLTTYGKSTGFCIDPIEKKPLNHFYPGTSVLSFGTAGCNLGCKFCQNWSISKSREVERLSELAMPQNIARAALELGCRSVAFTYNDPVIWAEYAIDAANACRAVGIKTVAVTAGYITPVARGPFFAAMDAANVDLKGFTEDFYRHYTLSHLDPVLDTLRWLRHESSVWLEITNLVIPNANDNLDDIRRMCQWILDNLGDDVPLHFTAFHPDFRMMDTPPTPPATLVAAWDIARGMGLKHVYTGNVDDVTRQSTVCPHCGKLLIERNWYDIGAYNLRGDRCGHCGGRVAGHFDPRPGDWGRRRLPVDMRRFAHPLPVVTRPDAVSAVTSTAAQPPRENVASSSQRIAGPNAMSSSDNSAEPLRRDDRSTPYPPAASNPTAPRPTERPNLGERQEAVIHHRASQLVVGGVIGKPINIADPALAGLGSNLVDGAFVTLKRRGRLRACCGVYGRPLLLADALAMAARRTVYEDVRMPTISATELRYLDLEVWLLYGTQPIALRGADRASAVVIGKHGLHITRGDARGLLLPGVATDNGLDAAGFLDHVAIKAGLPPSAWKQDDAEVYTFEGVHVESGIDESVLPDGVDETRLLYTSAELAKLADFCRGNIAALFQGATPSYYLPEVSDANVVGASIVLRFPARLETPQIEQLSMRPGVPLQATLFALCEAAVRLLKSSNLDRAGMGGMRVGVTLFYDPAMHGSVAEPDMRGIDTTRRAIVVKQHDKKAWMFDPERSPEELLDLAARHCQVNMPAESAVYTLAAQSTETSVMNVNIPQPVHGPAVRPPAVAGAFYPADPDELSKLVDELTSSGPNESSKPIERQRWPAVMIPHAGLIYSGRIAADVLKRVEIPSTVIVIGPKHTRLGVEWAVAPHKTWSIPGATIESNPELARQLTDAIEGLQFDTAAHLQEHAIEVELPLLARLAPSARVVGIAIGGGNLERCRKFATGLAKVLRGRKHQVLLAISSDMNHFANDAENRRLDEMALAAMESLDAERLLETVTQRHISMCGVLPAVIVMETLRQLGQLHAIERVGYATSADVTGDRSRVVGYAGLLLG